MKASDVVGAMADRVLALVNSSPRTPTKEELVKALSDVLLGVDLGAGQPGTGRVIIDSMSSGGHRLVTFERAEDVYERWMAGARETEIDNLMRKQGLSREEAEKAYGKERLPFETVSLRRRANGTLNFAEFSTWAFNTEQEAVQNHRSMM